jgi:hypothetical protein
MSMQIQKSDDLWSSKTVTVMLCVCKFSPCSPCDTTFHVPSLFIDRAIHTYAGRATLKPNLPDPQQHAVIYTGTQCPQAHSEVMSDGTVIYEELALDPIRVNSEQMSSEGTLSPLSRVNFSKIYTVEKNLRVLNIGVICKECIPILEANSPLKTSFVRENYGSGSQASAKSLGQIMDAENTSSISQESDSEANFASKANATNTSRKLNDRKHEHRLESQNYR